MVLILRREMIVMDNTKPVRSFIQFLLPSMLSMIMLAAYTFADTFVVGRKLGSTALGAMGICTPVLTVTYAFGFLSVPVREKRIVDSGSCSGSGYLCSRGPHS